jgi:hypothetical protein
MIATRGDAINGNISGKSSAYALNYSGDFATKCGDSHDFSVECGKSRGRITSLIMPVFTGAWYGIPQQITSISERLTSRELALY